MSRAKGRECFCCGTPAASVADLPRYRRRWRIKCLVIGLGGAVLIASSFIILRGAAAGGVGAGVGIGFAAFSLILIDKFPRGGKASE